MATPIVYLTYAGMRRYTRAFVQLLRAFYVPPPALVVITDRDCATAEPQIQTGTRDWVVSLQAGLSKWRERHSDTHVLLILDDLVPTRPVDVATVERHAEIMRREGWKKLSFFIDAAAERPFEKVEIASEPFYRIPRPGEPGAERFPWYNSLQVSLWEVDYLEEVCRQSLAEGVHNPWKFEYVIARAEHFVSPYPWPGEFHGLHFLHNVHLDAVRKIAGQPATKRYLYWCWLLGLPSQIAWRIRIKWLQTVAKWRARVA